jgi:hypothetical protein
MVTTTFTITFPLIVHNYVLTSFNAEVTFADDTAMFNNVQTNHHSGFNLRKLHQPYPAGGVRTRPPNT